ncbi:SMP-30/gluconolactonase/LRE family protein [Mycobacterium terramassiliense]|uniref:SMP-30/gluconolactonase/LRE family protein n=1 Tax=Mycobacterium terramassiliense TaxID=1841859 RepID=UPI0012FF843A|nr:SMP-30/gluconolactonase/LRE family protein [Mycobacterium terramassiliense]
MAHGLHLPECPRWHDGRLWFSDIRGHLVCRLDDDRTTIIHRFPEDEEPAGLGWLPNGELLVVGMTGRVVYRVADESAVVHADLKPLAPYHVNDMVVVADGTAFVTQTGFDLDAAQPNPQPTAVIRVDPDGTTRTAARELLVPNGIAVNSAEDTLVVAESGAARLSAYTLREGVLADRSLEALPASADFSFCAPDGLCLDEKGGRWVADSINKRIFRVEGGVITDEHRLGQFTLACALGDDDRRSLYVCVTDVWHRTDIRDEPTGRIVRIRVDIPGTGRP